MKSFRESARKLHAFFHEEWHPPTMEDKDMARVGGGFSNSGDVDVKRPKMALATRVKTRPQTRDRGGFKRK